MRGHRAVRALGAAAAVVALSAVAGSCAAPPAACGGVTPRHLPEFVFGSSATDISTSAIDEAAAQGSRWVRIPIRWAFLQPTVPARPALRRGDLAAHPELVEEFAAAADWSIPDRVLAHAAAAGQQVMGFVGLPTLPTLDGEMLNPASLGRESYLADQELVTRAIVRRYGPQRIGAPADTPTITVWVLEGELNIAPAQTLFGWRYPAGLDGFLASPWADFAFQTDLLRGIARGVRHEDPDAVTMTLLNTDMADAFNTTFGRPGWADAIERWRTIVDVFGIDTYPNYFLADPVDGTKVGRDVARARAAACPGQQVMVTETNAPNGPVARGYSPEKQAEFLSEAWESSKAAGVAGFMPFGITQDDVTDPTFSPTDRANLDQVGRALRTGDLGALAGLYLGQSDWITNRLPTLAQAVEAHWGIVRRDGTPLPAYDVYRRIATETAGA